MEDKRTYLSDNFTIRECERSEYAMRNGIDNILPSIYYDNARNIAKYILESVREKFGLFTPQSWYRGMSLNDAVGGSKNSQHCTASAVDFEIVGIDNLTVALWIRDNLIYDQLILECYNGNPTSGWVHVSWTKGKNRQENLRFDGKEYKKGLE